MGFNSVRNVIIESTIFVTLLLAYPFVICQMVSVPSLKIVYGFSAVLVLILSLSYKKNIHLPQPLKICLLLHLLLFVVLLIIHSDIGFIEAFSFALFSYIYVWSLQKTSGLKSFFVKYNVIICLMSLAGLVAFILVFLELIDPLFTFENRDGRNAWCFGLTCTNVYIGNIIRASGYFDEPGALAYWGVFSLLINRLFIKNKYVEIGLIIGLIFTLSMAYFIQLFCYVLLFYRKKKKALITVSVFLSLIGFFGYTLGTTDSDVLYRLTFNRFDKAKEGDTNRTGISMEHAIQMFQENPILGVGVTKMKTANAGDNPYESLACYGLFGSFLLYFPLIMILTLRRGKEFTYAVIILFIGYLQRPFHPQLIHFFMIYSFLTLCYYEKKKCPQSISNNNLL